MASTSTCDAEDESTPATPKLVIATRLHLGRAAAPPTNLQAMIDTFESWTSQIPNATAVIAVDSTPKFPDYDYVQAVQHCCKHKSTKVLPVTPWGKFVPALNALVTHAAHSILAEYICFVSAEVTPSLESIQQMCQQLDKDTDNVLVVGAALPGHIFAESSSSEATTAVPLNGRTCPWNTLAIWNLKLLQHTGFALVSDLPDCAGVEECAAIALHQKLYGTSKALLLQLPNIEWKQDFDQDPIRKAWHEQKMKSKLDRAEKQIKVLQVTGTGSVIHKRIV